MARTISIEGPIVESSLVNWKSPVTLVLESLGTGAWAKVIFWPTIQELYLLEPGMELPVLLDGPAGVPKEVDRDRLDQALGEHYRRQAPDPRRPGGRLGGRRRRMEQAGRDGRRRPGLLRRRDGARGQGGTLSTICAQP